MKSKLTAECMDVLPPKFREFHVLSQVSSSTAEKLVAQFLFVVGVIILLLGTYVTLNEADIKNRQVTAAAAAAERNIFKAPPPLIPDQPPVVDIPAKPATKEPLLPTVAKKKIDQKAAFIFQHAHLWDFQIHSFLFIRRLDFELRLNLLHR